MSVAKNSRLEALFNRLKHNHASISELSIEFKVSEKTIQRDLKALQKMGVYKAGRVFKLDESKAVDGLNDDERLILGIMNELCKNNGKEFYLRAKPLLARLTSHLEQPVLIGMSSEKLNERNLLDFELVSRAILQQHFIEFRFHHKMYLAKPLKLGFFDGFWYLFVLDCSKKDEEFKKFYFKDLREIRLLKSTFSVDEALSKKLTSINSVWFNFHERFVVQLLIAKQMSKYFTRKALKDTQLYPQSDGSLVLELEISHVMQIKPLIYQYIPYIKVLEPEWLAKEIKNELKSFVKEL